MGVKNRSRILLAAFLAALMLLGSFSNARLWPWLSAKTMDDLYGLLNWALGAVIIGVIVEEFALLWKGWKFARLVWEGEIKKAFSKAWLHKREIAEGGGFIILVIGLAGELALDPLIETRQKADQLEKAEEISKAMGAAATANTKAADLLAENVELERDLAPRDINLADIINALKSLPRVPIFVSTINDNEPKKTAGGFLGLPAAHFGPGERWNTIPLPLSPWHWPGITFSYVGTRGGAKSSAENVAIALCETLKSEGIDARTEAVHFEDGKTPTPGWTPSLPQDAVVIGVGAKPKLFWENKWRRARGLPDEMDAFFCTSEEAIAAAQKQQELDKKAANATGK